MGPRVCISNKFKMVLMCWLYVPILRITVLEKRKRKKLDYACFSSHISSVDEKYVGMEQAVGRGQQYYINGCSSHERKPQEWGTRLPSSSLCSPLCTAFCSSGTSRNQPSEEGRRLQRALVGCGSSHKSIRKPELNTQKKSS